MEKVLNSLIIITTRTASTYGMLKVGSHVIREEVKYYEEKEALEQKSRQKSDTSS